MEVVLVLLGGVMSRTLEDQMQSLKIYILFLNFRVLSLFIYNLNILYMLWQFERSKESYFLHKPNNNILTILKITLINRKLLYPIHLTML